MKNNKIKARQKRFYKEVKRFFTDAMFDYKHPEMKFRNSGRKMELDIFIPSINLAIEYQGLQHYRAMVNWGGEKSFQEIKRRDQEKKESCKRIGIRLIEISCKENVKPIDILEIIKNNLSINLESN